MKILIAYDASPSADAAVEEVIRRPWSEGSEVKMRPGDWGAQFLRAHLSAAARVSLHLLGWSRLVPVASLLLSEREPVVVHLRSSIRGDVLESQIIEAQAS
jgi:hypothetical protein